MQNQHPVTIIVDGPAALRSFWRAAAPATRALLRIGAAILFMQHGVQKLFGLMGGVDGAGATAPLFSLMGLAGFLEFFGGLLLLLGLFTRPVAFVLFVEMIAAYVIAHLPQGGWPVENQGELALLYALIFAFLCANGAGRFSLDERLVRRAATPVSAPPRQPRPVEEAPRWRGADRSGRSSTR